MFFEYLAHIRNQPLKKRKRFAFTVAIVSTGVILILWLSVHMIGKPTSGTSASEPDPLQNVADSFTQTMHTVNTKYASSSYTKSEVQFSNSFVEQSGSSTSPLIQLNATGTATTSTEQPPLTEPQVTPVGEEVLKKGTSEDTWE